MSNPLNLPPVGENIDGGDVVKVLVKSGDTIAVDQPLLELETGKATVEVPSPAAGRVESARAARIAPSTSTAGAPSEPMASRAILMP